MVRAGSTGGQLGRSGDCLRGALDEAGRCESMNLTRFIKEHLMATAIVTVHGGPSSLATVLGQVPARIPTAGKIRAGIKVLTRTASEASGSP